MKEIKLLSEAETEQRAMQRNENEEKNSKLFHYTSIDTLSKILSNPILYKGEICLELRASSIFSMNDPSEMVYASEYLLSTLKSVESQLNITDKNICLSEYVNKKTESGKYIKDIILEELPNMWNMVSVLSFSSNSDSLQMWAMYANDGNGVALGFNEKNLKEYARHFNIPSLFCKVAYFKDELPIETVRRIKSLYNSYIEDLNVKPASNAECQLRNILLMCSIIGASIKHNAYRSESEYRMISNTNQLDKVNFGTNKKGHRFAYIPHFVPIKYLDEIIIGPCCDAQLVQNTMSLKLHQINCSAKILKSEIPYRNF